MNLLPKWFMWVIYPVIPLHTFMAELSFMEQVIITVHGMAAIIIHDQLPGDMEYIITLIPAGDSQLV